LLGSTYKFWRLGRAGRPDAAGRSHSLQLRFARQVKPRGASALAVGRCRHEAGQEDDLSV